MKLHPKIDRALTLINACIFELLINNKGKISIPEIEKITGLNEIDNSLTASVLKHLRNKRIIKIQNGYVYANTVLLKKIISHEPKKPIRHGAVWGENDWLRFANLKKQGLSTKEIAARLGRTRSACQTEFHILNRAFSLMPIIRANNTINNLKRTDS